MYIAKFKSILLSMSRTNFPSHASAVMNILNKKVLVKVHTEFQSVINGASNSKYRIHQNFEMNSILN